MTNLLLRFLWTVTLVPENAPNLFPHDFQIYISPVIAAAEIVRRYALLWVGKSACVFPRTDAGEG